MRRLFFFFIAISFVLSPAQAALISTNDSSFGADSITLDTSNNLEWLDLTFSTGYSFDDLSTEFLSGGLFDGFRLATIEEVQTLFDSASLPAIGSTTDDFTAVDALISLVGATSNQDGYLQSLGLTGSAGSFSGSHLVTGLDFLWFNGDPLYELTGGLSYGSSFGPDTVGAWLVRGVDAAVPAPSTLTLMAVALMLIIGTRITKQPC